MTRWSADQLTFTMCTATTSLFSLKRGTFYNTQSTVTSALHSASTRIIPGIITNKIKEIARKHFMAVSGTLRHAKQRTKICTKSEQGKVKNLKLKVTANENNRISLISCTLPYLFWHQFEVSWHRKPGQATVIYFGVCFFDICNLSSNGKKRRLTHNFLRLSDALT